jgi:hypothetical protein
VEGSFDVSLLREDEQLEKSLYCWSLGVRTVTFIKLCSYMSLPWSRRCTYSSLAELQNDNLHVSHDIYVYIFSGSRHSRNGREECALSITQTGS